MAIDKKTTEFTVWLSKIFFLYLLVVTYGFLKTFIFLFIFVKVKSKIIKKIFNLTSFKPIDYTFLSDDEADRFNLVSIMKLDNFNPEKLKQIIIKKAIPSIPKLRMKITWCLFNYYWKEVDIGESIERIKIEPKILNNEKEMLKYAQNLSNQYFDIENELPWEVTLVAYGNNKGAFIWKCDHVMTDGLGILSLMCSLANNYCEDIFPSIMKINTKSKFSEFLFEVCSYFIFFFHIPYILNSSKNYKSQHRHLKKVGKSNGRFKTAFSDKTYKLSDFEKFRKNEEMSFNEIMISVVSHAIASYVKSNFNCDSCDKLYYYQPFGRKILPKNIDQVQLCNDAKVILIEIPLLKDFRDAKYVKNSLRKRISPWLFESFMNFLRIVSELSTFGYFRFKTTEGMNNAEISISNVPGPTQLLFFDEMVLTGINCIASSGPIENFFPIISYNKNIGFSYSVDEQSIIDPEKMVSIIQGIIEEKVLDNEK